jgi:hypothetical protein
MPIEMKGKAGAAAQYVISNLSNNREGAFVSFTDVMKQIGLLDRRNFKRDIRGHEIFEIFKAALVDHGIIEWPEKRPTCFKRAFDAYFGGAYEAKESGTLNRSPNRLAEERAVLR